jgi:RNA polymerase sigma-70 factor (ECF subfamily)
MSGKDERNRGVVTPDGTSGETTTDQSLLARVGRKEEVALAALYDRYSGLVFSEARRILRDTGAAEEILQDLFYQVWRTPDRFDASKGSLAGWLLLAARSRAVWKLRRKSGKSEDLDENSVIFRKDMESHATQHLLVERVRKALGSLPEGQRETLECAYFEGMSLTEIAEKTGQPLGTIKARILSAMDALKKVLSE